MASRAFKSSRYLRLTKASVSVGDVVNVNGITGIAMTDTDADGKVELELPYEAAFFDMSVVGSDQSGDVAVAIGDPLYVSAAGVVSKNSEGAFVGRAIETVSSGATATIAVMLGAGAPGGGSDGPGVGGLNSATLSFAFDDMTDGGGAAGTIAFPTGAIPAGALILGWKVNVTEGFTGDTTAVMKVGVSGDDDRFSADTSQSVLATGVKGSMAIAADAADGIGAAVTPLVTITGGSDFGGISAGAAAVTVYYL